MKAVDERIRMPNAARMVPQDYSADSWQKRTDGEVYCMAEFELWG